MNEEAGFLSAIGQKPIDDTARLVYADWLDEQSDSTGQTKAELIRLELQLLAAPERDRPYWRGLKRLSALATGLPSSWLIVISSPEIGGCTANQCPERWSRLDPTEEQFARSCGGCKRTVRYCETVGEVQSRVANGERFALTIALTFPLRFPPPQPPPPRHLAPPRQLGAQMPDTVLRLVQTPNPRQVRPAVEEETD